MIILFLFQIFNLLLRWLRGRGAEKNNTVLFYYVDHVNRGLFESVDHKCMVHGHSFLENDQDFAQIENRKKYSMVLLPDDWAPVIQGANTTNPFKVHKMQQGEFQDWKGHLEGLYHLLPKDTGGNPVQFREIHWINIGWGERRLGN